MNAKELKRVEYLQDVKKKSVTGAISYFIRTLILQGIGLVSIFILSSYFSPEDFGIYGFVIQIIGILVFFSDVGLAASLIQKNSEPTANDYRSAFTVQQILSWVIFGIILIILLTGFVQAKTGETGKWILLALGISFPLATFKTIPSVILERKLDFSKLILPQIFEQIVFHGILIYMALSGSGSIAYAYAIVARSIVGVAVMTILQPWSFGIALDKNSLKVLLGFGVKFQINDFLARIKDQLFYLFLGLILPLRDFGYIQWAKNWSMYPYNLTVQNMLAITFPAFSRLQGHTEALKKAIEKSLFFITLAIFPILAGMSVFIFPFISLVPKWNKWEPAAFSLILFSLSIAWGAISTPLTNTLNAIGKINLTLKLMIFWTILTWILTPIGIYYFGFNGVSIAALLISFTSVLSVYLVKKIIPIEFIDQVWRQFVAALMMSLVGMMGMNYWKLGFVNFGFGLILTSFVYLITLLLLGRNKILQEVRSLK
ncbi:MAG: oligosaccharide flippase family protein [Pseudomonadales bacterium]|nr:oligosaccharide flippase family protein [Pseudomonadales bacterium]